ncbi:FMN-binding negative transcriptional regulator [Sphingobacterium sp. MYb382]|uniref:FMN-binding negative transcriptional regulator n=1 Tax=Sphingobacterium sp. MYb382 TaxID=2745278 RepID=UPI0030ACC1D0
MYVPRSFIFDNQPEQVAFMKQYSFATIVTIKGNMPIATQLPFFVDDSGDKLLLRSHFAVANEQVKYLSEKPSLVIFTEPHAYISPSHYDKEESVPTWDYVAIHAYGTATLIQEEEAKLKVLEEAIQFYEPAYLAQWNSLSDKYRLGMLRGMVAFEIEVTDLQGQKKVSQNKNAEERKRIAEALAHSDVGVERDLATYIPRG